MWEGGAMWKGSGQGCTGFEYNHVGDENYQCITYNAGAKNIQNGTTQSSSYTSCIKGSNKLSYNKRSLIFF